MPNPNNPVKCNSCNHLYYRKPQRKNHPCDLCKSPNITELSEQEATAMMKDVFRNTGRGPGMGAV